MSTDPEPAERLYGDPVSDSSRWQHFVPREGDIVVSTPPKCGTTWIQGILALLISGDPGVDADVTMRSPWIDMKFRDVHEVMARLDAQDVRRHVKTHSPFGSFPYWQKVRYIAVYRHPVDVYFSLRKHRANIGPEVGLSTFPDDPSEGFHVFLANEADHMGFPMFLDHYRSTLAMEPRENLLRLHYADMTRDLAGAVAQIAAHVGIAHPPARMAELVEAATFSSMKANAERFVPSSGQGFWRSDSAFFDSATSRKWEGVLKADDLAAYDAVVDASLSREERAWLEWGGARQRQG